MTPLFPPDRGGVASAAARLARGLSRHLPVEVLTPTAALAPGRLEVETEDGLTVVRFGIESTTETQQRWFELLTQRGPYRLVHAVYPSRTGFVAAYGARYLNIPCLLAARGNDLDRDAFRPEHLAGLLHALAEADAVVGVSRALMRQAHALGARRHATWIPNGVDSKRFRPVPPDGELAARLRLAEAFPVVGFVGEARRKKGLVTMLEAFRSLLATHPAARLLMVGEVRPGDRPLLEIFLAQHPEVAQAVVQAGQVPQESLPEYYALMDVLWHPSTHDGLPNAVLEVLACGRLAIGARVGGLTDILETEELPGLLVPPRDPEALAEATRGAIADPRRRAALEEKAREHVLAEFSLAREVNAYLALYEQLTGTAIPASH